MSALAKKLPLTRDETGKGLNEVMAKIRAAKIAFDEGRWEAFHQLMVEGRIMAQKMEAQALYEFVKRNK